MRLRKKQVVCDACGKYADVSYMGTPIFWLSGTVDVRPYHGIENLRRKKTNFDVCSTRCLVDFLSQGSEAFLKRLDKYELDIGGLNNGPIKGCS